MKRQTNQGFTLVELIIFMAIVADLGALAIRLHQNYVVAAKVEAGSGPLDRGRA